jgi:endonuclease G
MHRHLNSKWLPAVALGVLLSAVPFWARAGLVGALVGKAVEHHAEGAVKKVFEREAPPPVALPQGGSFAQCAHLFPGGIPLDIKAVDARWKPRALCSGSYAVIYSGLTKTPLLVVERLTKEQLADALNEERTNQFYADPRVPPGERSTLEDYAHPGPDREHYDRGHIAPAGDMPDQVAMAQSFALSNIVPQNAVNNRKGGAWFKVEGDTRKFARRAAGNVFVFSGPLFKGQPQLTIGKSQVWVPTTLFKMVYDEAGKRSWAHIIPNAAEAVVGAPVDYAAFVRETGWRPLGAQN